MSIRILLLAALLAGGLSLWGQATGPAAANTRYGETAPVLSADGQYFFFSRRGHPRNRGTGDASDIWMMSRTGERWSAVLNAGSPVNSAGADQLIGLGPALTWAAVLRLEEEPVILMLHPRARAWTEARHRPLPVELPADRLGDMQLDIQGHRLLFAADLPGGRGGLDLYIAFWQPATGEWSPPLNLGPAVNTAADENYPRLAADARTLYFASNRSGGQGGYDHFLSRRTGEDWQQWSAVMPLDSFNTEQDDHSLAVTLTGGPVVGIRRSAEGDTDLQVWDSLPSAYRPLPVDLVGGRCRLPADQLKMVKAAYRTPSGQFDLPLRPDGSYCLARPADEPLYIRAGAPDYFAPGLSPHSVRYLDYDPNFSLVSANMNTAYFQRENTIEELRQELEQVEKEIIRLSGQRQERQQELLHNLQRWKAPVLPDSVALALRRSFSAGGSNGLSYDSLYERSLLRTLQAQWPAFVRTTTRQFIDRRSAATVQPDTAAVIGRLTSLLPVREQIPFSGWQREWTDELQTGLTAPVRQALNDQFRPGVESLLSTEARLEARRFDARRFEQQLRQLVMEQVREEEKQGVSAGIDGPVPQTTSRPAGDVQELQRDLLFQPIQTGEIFVLGSLNFAPNSIQLAPGAHTELDRIFELLQANPRLRIEISSHTHGRVGHATAMRLSSQRARVLADYLNRKGIERERVQYRGAGKTRPLAGNETEAGRQRNQRIEMRITDH